ncbi:MAG: methyltransferase domain-containing protein [Deltaproteobacteria bacterium]|nr:methyltransferase domain-containing protein [Deltaproteobacteria bacterium]
MPLESIKTEHIAAVIEAERQRFGDCVKILDAGCGGCNLIQNLHERLLKSKTVNNFEIYGFDVNDFKREGNFLDRPIHFLTNRYPEIPWQDRLKLVGQNDKWPFENQYFEVVISDQVVEHLKNHLFFFSEMARVLSPTGFSLQSIPFREKVFDGHVSLPLAHKFKSYDFIYNFIYLFSLLGFGKYKEVGKRKGITISEYSINQADYLVSKINYLSRKEFLSLCKSLDLKVSYNYSTQFVFKILRAKLTAYELFKYNKQGYRFLDYLISIFVKYFKSMPVFIEKTKYAK